MGKIRGKKNTRRFLYYYYYYREGGGDFKEPRLFHFPTAAPWRDESPKTKQIFFFFIFAPKEEVILSFSLSLKKM
jgi:hypothetical protein